MMQTLQTFSQVFFHFKLPIAIDLLTSAATCSKLIGLHELVYNHRTRYTSLNLLVFIFGHWPVATR